MILAQLGKPPIKSPHVLSKPQRRLLQACVKLASAIPWSERLRQPAGRAARHAAAGGEVRPVACVQSARAGLTQPAAHQSSSKARAPALKAATPLAGSRRWSAS